MENNLKKVTQKCKPKQYFYIKYDGTKESAEEIKKILETGYTNSFFDDQYITRFGDKKLGINYLILRCYSKLGFDIAVSVGDYIIFDHEMRVVDVAPKDAVEDNHDIKIKD